MKGFDVKHGFKYDKDVYVQSRMQFASIMGKVILFPTMTTSTYFHYIINGYHSLLSGTKGTGKSFSFLIYAYLTSFKVQHLVNLGMNQKNPLLQVIDQQSVNYQVSHLCYITMKDKIDYSSYFIQIMKQFPDIYPIQEIKKDFNIHGQHIAIPEKIIPEISISDKSIAGKSMFDKSIADKSIPFMVIFIKNIQKLIFSSEPLKALFSSQNGYKIQKQRIFTRDELIRLLTIIQIKSKNYGIKTVCVLDQANRIYRLIRQLHIKVQDSEGNVQLENIQEYKQLAFYHDILAIFTDESKQSHFDSAILNSSQDFDIADHGNGKFLKDISKNIQFLKMLQYHRKFERRVTIQYSEVSNKVAGQIQLYNVFWFELLRFIARSYNFRRHFFKNGSVQQKLSQHRKCFEEQFGLSSTKRKQISQWKSQVRYLDIREYFDKEVRNPKNVLLQFQSSLLLVPTLQKDQHTKICQNFGQLKRSIEESRKNEVIKNMNKFIKQGASLTNKHNRLEHLKNILASARKYHKQGARNGIQDYSNYKYLAQIEVQYKKMIVQRLKIGFVNQQSLTFSMSPLQLIELIQNFMNNNQVIFIYAQMSCHLLIDPKTKKLNADFVNFLDRFSYPLFRAGKVQLNYKQYTSIQSEKGYKFQQNDIQITDLASCPIIGITNLNDIEEEKNKIKYMFLSKSQKEKVRQFDQAIKNANQQKGKFISESVKMQVGLFDKIVKKADQEKGKFIAGYPVEYFNIQEQAFGRFQQNALFDNMIIKRSDLNGQRARYEIILYEWAMGKPNSKTVRNFKEKIKSLLILANIKADIDCKLLIVAPDYQVQDYLKKLNGNTDEKIPENLFIYDQIEEPKINKETYKWKISTGVASFHQPPFQSHHSNDLILEALYRMMQQGLSVIRRALLALGK